MNDRNGTLMSLLRGRRVAVLYLNLGPYHVARLRAIAKALEAYDARLVAIELAAVEGFYPWRVHRSSEHFEWKTLFTDREVESIPAAEQRAAVRALLDEQRPAAAVIVGYSHPYMHQALAWTRKSGALCVLCGTSTARTGLTRDWQATRRVWWKELYKRYLLRGVDAGLAGGNECRDYLTTLGVPRERIFIKYDVVDNDFFTRVADEVRRDRPLWRQRLDLPERFFFYPARILDIKNHVRLLQAYRLYLQRAGQRPWGMVFIGSGPADATVDAHIAELNCPLVSRRKFAQINEIAQYYGLASALVFPSLNETWGLIVNEAAAASLPVLVSTGCTCLEHLLQEGENGFTLDPYDIEQMADCLTRIASLSDEDLARMGAASKRIVDEWRPEDHAAELLNAIAAGAAARSGRK